MSGEKDKMVVSAVGLASSLGTSEMACNAARAGLNMLQLLNLKIPNEGISQKESDDSYLKGHPYHDFTKGLSGLDRLLCLGQDALKELLDNRPVKDYSRCAIIVNLGDGFHGVVAQMSQSESGEDSTVRNPMTTLAQTQESYREQLIPKLLEQSGCKDQPFFATIGFGGKPGIVNSLALAQTLLDQGQVDQCILGSIESCLDTDTIKTCLSLEILKTDVNSAGFIPGEAAAFLLVEKQKYAQQQNSNYLAVIENYHIAQSSSQRFLSEQSTIDQVQPLQETIAHCLSGTEPEDLVMYCDFSGEPERAKTWAYTQNRLTELLNNHKVLQSFYPASNFGEVGAPFAYISTILACHGFSKGYIGSQNALIWSLSDNGTSGSLMLSSGGT